MSALPVPGVVVALDRGNPTPYYEAKWVSPAKGGKQIKRRLGKAWVDRKGDAWVKRRGSAPEGWIDPRTAAALAAEKVRDVEAELTPAVAPVLAPGRVPGPATMRELAHEWIGWAERVQGMRPATVRDYKALLNEPGAPHKRGAGKSKGWIMRAFGDRDPQGISAREYADFLGELDDAGLSARNVNKYRQTLSVIHTYAQRQDTYGFPTHPVKLVAKRAEPRVAALDYYEPHEVDALCAVLRSGAHRPERVNALTAAEMIERAWEDARDADMMRVLFETGLRIGELRPLRWGYVDLDRRMILVDLSMSAGLEVDGTKGGGSRWVPMSLGTVEILRRMTGRPDFTEPEDYVFCGREGQRIDDSSLRRRYKAACEVAGLRAVKLHGLRHAAGSIFGRHASAIEVRDFLGHAKLSTTDRYMSAKFSDEFMARLDAGFAPKAMEATNSRGAP